MTITSTFYDGTVDEQAWSEGVPRVGASEYGVVGVNDLRVTAVSGQDRTVAVAVGKAWGKGIHDIVDAVETVQLPSVSTGSRWDLIAVRRVWSTNTTTIVRIAGSGTRGIPAGRLTGFGTTDDQPLALVRVQKDSTVIQEIIDLRCWAGNGGMFAADKLALSYLEMPGAVVQVGEDRWFRTTSPGWRLVSGQKDVLSPATAPAGFEFSGSILVEGFGSGKKITVAINVVRTGSNLTMDASQSFQQIGVPIPGAARGSASLISQTGEVSGGGPMAYNVQVALNPVSGQILWRRASGFTFVKNAQFSFNASYYIL